MRNGALWRVEVATGQETHIVDAVEEFAVSPDGSQLAIVRGRGLEAEIWLAAADGSTGRQLTRDQRADAAPAWSSRNVLVYTSSAEAADTRQESFAAWAEWCAEAEIRTWEDGAGIQTIGQGCDPAWAPEGLRLAVASRPELAAQNGQMMPVGNAIRLMNWQGQNVWTPVAQNHPLPAGLSPERRGLLLNQPVWTPDGQSVLYARLVGYALLCDHSTFERTDGRNGGAELLGIRPDVVKRMVVSADGQYLAIDLAACNAPGFGGYNAVALNVLDLSSASQISGYPILSESPEAQVSVRATEVRQEFRWHSPAWSPDGAILAHIAPPAWPGAEERTPDASSRYNSTDPGELVVRNFATGASYRLLENVDFGSPLVWGR